MKTVNTIVKILTAIATLAGIVYIIATYGDKIVTWAKEIWAKLPKCPLTVEVSEDTPAETPAESAPAEEAAPEAPVVEEPVAEENVPVADEADFEA